MAWFFSDTGEAPAKVQEIVRQVIRAPDAQAPARSWRDTFLEDAAQNVSMVVQLIAPSLYCGFGVLALGCACWLWVYRRRKGLGAAFP